MKVIVEHHLQLVICRFPRVLDPGRVRNALRHHELVQVTVQLVGLALTFLVIVEGQDNTVRHIDKDLDLCL